jgi:hypothetical protein
VTLTHKSLCRLLSAIGEDHDKEVLEWRDSFIPLLREVCNDGCIIQFCYTSLCVTVGYSHYCEAKASEG